MSESTLTGRLVRLNIRHYLAAAAQRAGLADNDGSPLTFTPHDFRRLFLTDFVASGFPIHIAAQLAGHRDLNTTRGYTAIYPTEVFGHYEKFLARRRAERPGAEYRQSTPAMLEAFAEHFGRRRVELGDCVRLYGSGAPTNTPACGVSSCRSTPTPTPAWTPSRPTCTPASTPRPARAGSVTSNSRGSR